MATDVNQAFVFPGQGSQQVGMLADIAVQWPEILVTFAEASEAVGYDIWQLIQTGPQETLNLTENAQPALLTASVAIWRLLQAKGVPAPEFMAGHSLGEWSALVCAGVVHFVDAVKLVQLRGRYMQEAVPVGVGAMAAIIGLDDALIEKSCAEAAQGEVVCAVNYNSPGQVVIAGHAAAVNRAGELCKTAGAKRALTLPVSAPFHTSLMRPAADRLAAHIQQTEFRSPQIPVVHNVHARNEQNPQTIKNLMVEQIYSPVAWVSCVNFLTVAGISTVVEVGPGKVLGGLVKRISKDMLIKSTDSVDNLGQLLQIRQ
jgi:[acyl-carrier-protein] S-malonyltransferase